jgi:hypothetical protein
MKEKNETNEFQGQPSELPYIPNSLSNVDVVHIPPNCHSEVVKGHCQTYFFNRLFYSPDCLYTPPAASSFIYLAPTIANNPQDVLNACLQLLSFLFLCLPLLLFLFSILRSPLITSIPLWSPAFWAIFRYFLSQTCSLYTEGHCLAVFPPFSLWNSC